MEWLGLFLDSQPLLRALLALGFGCGARHIKRAGVSLPVYAVLFLRPRNGAAPTSAVAAGASAGLPSRGPAGAPLREANGHARVPASGSALASLPPGRQRRSGLEFQSSYVAASISRVGTLSV